MCSKCGHTHYGFNACGSDAANKAHRLANQPAPQLIESKHRTDRPWGDRLDSIEMRGTTVLQKDWKIRRRGGVIEHPDWKDAA